MPDEQEAADDCLENGHQSEEEVGRRGGLIWMRCGHCDAEWEEEEHGR